MARQHRRHIDDPAAFGLRLHEARSAAGLRLTDLRFDGCSIGYLSHLENGKRVPSLQVVRELATRLAVPEAWLALGEDELQATAATSLAEAEAAARFDDRETAAQLYHEVLERGTDAERARAGAGLAFLQLGAGDPRGAIIGFEAALELDPGIGADPGFADALGRTYATVGEIELALAVFRSRYETACADEDDVNQYRFAVLLANALIDSSQLGDAANILAGLIVSGVGAGDPVALARVHWSQSRLHAMRKDSVSAARHARKALDLLEATDYVQQRARAHQLLAYIELDAGRPEAAIELVKRGRELAGWGATPGSLALLDLEEARARAQIGELEEAASLAMRASQTLADHHPSDVGRCFAEIAGVLDRSGDLPRSRELYELAIEYLEQQVPNSYLPDTLTCYADVLERLGDRDRAFATYKRAAVGRAELVDRAVGSGNGGR